MATQEFDIFGKLMYRRTLLVNRSSPRLSETNPKIFGINGITKRRIGAELEVNKIWKLIPVGLHTFPVTK
jgi:hypothetical protein